MNQNLASSCAMVRDRLRTARNEAGHAVHAMDLAQHAPPLEPLGRHLFIFKSFYSNLMCYTPRRWLLNSYLVKAP